MKKYILLISLFCLTAFYSQANNPQDTIIIRKGKIVIPDMDGKFDNFKNFKFEFDSSQLEAIRNAGKFDSNQLLAMRENMRINMKDLNTNLSNMRSNILDSYSTNDKAQNTKREPDRVEKKNFSNISEIEFFHKYGNIVVQETNSKQIELEIQYFDSRNQKGSATVSTSGKLLSISTNNTGGSNSAAKINYIISIPKNISLNIDQKYGDVRIGRYAAPFSLNLNYGNISVQNFSGIQPTLNLKYSNMKINEAQDITISASYSKINVDKANTVEIKGNYNDYVFGDIGTITTGGSSSYGNMKIGTVHDIKANVMYADIVIDNLISSFDVKTSYGDVNIKSVSSKLKSINVISNYADVTITLPTNMAVEFDTRMTYGDLKISKKYTVNYTEKKATNTTSTAKGQIGNGKPTAKISGKNSYADIQIR